MGELLWDMAHPHIPLLLMAMVTSPGWSVEPDGTVPAAGSASAT